jgi:hypothetical protein
MPPMLEATDEERQHIVDYLAGQAPDEKIKLIQKVYSEHLHSIKHDIWDVHTNRGRWWVIINPTNLYSQKMFPDMDLALTFHVGLCLRIPSTKRRALKDLWIEPLIGCWRSFEQAQEAFKQADEVEAFQAVGMRCREATAELSTTGASCRRDSRLGDATEEGRLSRVERQDRKHCAGGRYQP